MRAQHLENRPTPRHVIMRFQNKWEQEETLQLSEEKQLTYTELGINGFRITMPGGRGQWNNAFKILKEKELYTSQDIFRYMRSQNITSQMTLLQEATRKYSWPNEGASKPKRVGTQAIGERQREAQGKKSQDDRDSTGVKGNWSNGSRSESAGEDFFRKMNLRQYVMQLVHLRVTWQKTWWTECIWRAI